MFTRADIHKGDCANFLRGQAIKVLIPQPLGGGTIIGEYLADGVIRARSGLLYNLYELIAFWNPYISWNDNDADYVKNHLHYDEWIASPPINAYSEENSTKGKQLVQTIRDINHLSYPPKFVSAGYNGLYEDCNSSSYLDPKCGKEVLSWDEYNSMMLKQNTHIENVPCVSYEIMRCPRCGQGILYIYNDDKICSYCGAQTIHSVDAKTWQTNTYFVEPSAFAVFATKDGYVDTCYMRDLDYAQLNAWKTFMESNADTDTEQSYIVTYDKKHNRFNVVYGNPPLYDNTVIVGANANTTSLLHTAFSQAIQNNKLTAF